MARILFVDDEPDTLQTLKRAVELFGHEAILAANGQSAIHLAATHNPDLIVVDMHLPDTDGFSLIARLRAVRPAGSHTPLVMLSAGPELDAAKHAQAAGAEAYLQKPIHLKTLLELVNRLVIEKVNPDG